MNSIELKEKRDKVVDERKGLLDKIDAIAQTAETRTLDEKEQSDLKEIKSKVAKLNARIAELDSEITAEEAVENARKEEVKRVKLDQRSGEDKELDKLADKFSVREAILNIAGNKSLKGANAEAHAEGLNELVGCKLHARDHSIVIPRKMLDRVEKRTDIDQATAISQGTELDGYVDTLKEESVYNAVGINFQSAVGDIKTNIVTAMNWAWVAAENTAASDIGANPTSVTASPTWARGYVDISRTHLIQNPEMMGGYMRELARSEATLFDAALFGSSSVSNAPPAIAATSGVLTFTEVGTYAATTSVYSDFIEAIETLGANNAMSRNLKFVAQSLLFSHLFKSAQVSSVLAGMTGQTFYNQLIAGYQTIFSNHPAYTTTSADVIAGDFMSGVKAYQWGGLELYVDDVTQRLTDQIRVIGHKRVDWVVPKAAKFVKFTSLTA